MLQRTRWRKATADVVHWIIHEKLQESGLSFHPQTGAPWTKSRRPSAAACYYFVQYVHHSHFPLLGSLGDADVTLAEMKRLKSAGGAGVTKVLRTRVSPIAQLYVDDCMPNAYEIQAIRRATAGRGPQSMKAWMGPKGPMGALVPITCILHLLTYFLS